MVKARLFMSRGMKQVATIPVSSVDFYLLSLHLTSRGGVLHYRVRRGCAPVLGSFWPENSGIGIYFHWKISVIGVYFHWKNSVIGIYFHLEFSGIGVDCCTKNCGNGC